MFHIQLGSVPDRFSFDSVVDARAFAVNAISKKKCLFAYLYNSDKSNIIDASIVREDGKYLCYQYNKNRESKINCIRKDGELVR